MFKKKKKEMQKDRKHLWAGLIANGEDLVPVPAGSVPLLRCSLSHIWVYSEGLGYFETNFCQSWRTPHINWNNFQGLRKYAHSRRALPPGFPSVVALHPVQHEP